MAKIINDNKYSSIQRNRYENLLKITTLLFINCCSKQIKYLYSTELKKK